ncbi:hypothetical protein C3V36_10975 [Lachnospiraceae bacterium oral taxon 500]|nr:hypothetical protein C3V36_10975 [Lachnospiraceae bacterium oral taxon 500]
MANLMVMATKLLAILLLGVLVVLIGKTFAYFTELEKFDPKKSVLAWNILMMFTMAVFLIVKLVVM